MTARSPLTARRPLTVLLVAGVLGLAGCGGTDSATPAAGDEFNEADVVFAQHMAVHHEQAVEMSDLLLAKDGLDPEVATLAEEIRAAQQPEIELMESWLAEWDVDPDEGGSPDHEGMDHEGMDHADHDMAEMGGMLSGQELQQLEQASAAEAGDLYLAGMVYHHEGAVEMAETQLAEGENGAALELAEQIIATQNEEIVEMEELRATR